MGALQRLAFDGPLATAPVGHLAVRDADVWHVLVGDFLARDWTVLDLRDEGERTCKEQWI